MELSMLVKERLKYYPLKKIVIMIAPTLKELSVTELKTSQLMHKTNNASKPDNNTSHTPK